MCGVERGLGDISEMAGWGPSGKASNAQTAGSRLPLKNWRHRKLMKIIESYEIIIMEEQ